MKNKCREKLLSCSSALNANISAVVVCGCVKQMPFCWSQSTSIRLQPKSSQRPPGTIRRRRHRHSPPAALFPSSRRSRRRLNSFTSSRRSTHAGRRTSAPKKTEKEKTRRLPQKRHRQSVCVSAATRCHRQCWMLTDLLWCWVSGVSAWAAEKHV